MTSKTKETTAVSRRSFLRGAGLFAAGAAIGFPTIIPSKVFGAEAPSRKINIGMIGCGRQGVGANLSPFLSNPKSQVVAVCDVDSWRLNEAKTRVEKHYAASNAAESWKGCKAYRDFRDLLADKDVDAVMISTPDHWHAIQSIMAARAGKDVCCEKPITLSVREGRLVADAMKKHGRIFRTDSEFRSQVPYHRVCELVLNGAVGKLHTIRTGCPTESFAGEVADVMPVPEELDYKLWLGPAADAPYTTCRIHARKTLSSRPGWMRIRDYCDGMIGNWGTHLNDIAQWGNGTSDTGPVEIEATGSYHKGKLWNVLEKFESRFRYANGVELFYAMSEAHVRFEGEKGWVQVSAKNMGLYAESGVSASSEDILKSKIPADGVHLLRQPEKGNFIDCCISRGRTVADAEVGHRTNSISHLAQIAIQLGGAKLTWDPVKERFENEEANRFLSRPFYREGWDPEKL